MKTLLTSLFVLLFVSSFAQFIEPEDSEPESKANFGLGLGIDYGGIGMKLNVLPLKELAIFGGLGYNLDKAGFNLGATYRILPESQVVPTVSAMYGYNGVIVVVGAEHYNKTYYGTSIGAGVEFHQRRRNNFLNLEILVPFRSSEFHNDLDKVKKDPMIQINDPLPFAFSIGYHFKF